MHFEQINEIALRMGADYGRVRTLVNIENDIETRYLISLLRLP